MRTYSSEFEDEIARALVGCSIVKIDEDVVLLDDGRVLRLVGNGGCGGCSNGHYDLTYLNDMPVNAIMGVDVVRTDDPPGDRYYGHTRFELFVLAEDTRIKLAGFEGSDGNGYYGTGFYLEVLDPDDR